MLKVVGSPHEGELTICFLSFKREDTRQKLKDNSIGKVEINGKAGERILNAYLFPPLMHIGIIKKGYLEAFQ